MQIFVLLLTGLYFVEPALIAKSSIILDVKPWDDETDMKKLENIVRKIEIDGLLWGACKILLLSLSIYKIVENTTRLKFIPLQLNSCRLPTEFTSYKFHAS